MAKKKNPGGSADRKRRGMKTVVTPLSEDDLALIQFAAATYTGRDRAVTRFMAAAGRAFALSRLAELGIDWPLKNNPKNSGK